MLIPARGGQARRSASITMSREVVFDIETQNTFDEVGALGTRGLKVSVVGVYEYEHDRYSTFTEEELPKLWSIFEHADRVIGYNSRSFDIPVLNNYYRGDLSKLPQLDLLEVIKERLGFRLKLDDLAKGTLGTAKSGHGLQAVEWYKLGEIEKIKQYCLDDVRITRDIYEYAQKFKKLRYPDLGQTREFAILLPEMPKMAQVSLNLTLPF